ncbi:DUF1816 domain-containing protein [Myxacorys almedinensis]|uniref:DUF1816 domain-containing protein n=1 Tax=Myxacorys almedinensis A TaxID=2690445 RepID=A0A8J7Z1V9_9CYAN|nr:DUF1816 domain-containing protein [Myxacorys almedinensis]NDJ18524.1 DUF1816 domain-containing protein [Myxacorys almedinensis A]
MFLLKAVKEFASGFLQAAKQAWWVEISTHEPQCLYYFGPFARSNEAEAACPGYIEDLDGEGAIGVQSSVKRCRPIALTIVDGQPY